MKKRFTDIAITAALVVLILQVLGIVSPGGPRAAWATDVGINAKNSTPVVGGYDELWEAIKFVNPEGDDNLTGPDNKFTLGGDVIFLKKGAFKNVDGNSWHDNRVRYFFLLGRTRANDSISLTALPPIVSAWRVTGHIHGK